MHFVEPRYSLADNGVTAAEWKGHTIRYFFNLAGAVHDPDDLGLELTDLNAARHAAVACTAEFLQDRPDVVWLGDELRMEVTDVNQLILFTLIMFGVDSPSIGKADRS